MEIYYHKALYKTAPQNIVSNIEIIIRINNRSDKYIFLILLCKKDNV